jgi:hypothetical protein
MEYKEIKKSNELIFERLSILLNNRPDFITSEMVDELTSNFGLGKQDAFSLLLCAALGFDTEVESDRKIWDSYAPHMIHHLDESLFTSDPYYSAVRINDGKTSGEWELREDMLSPYTAFVCNDPLVLPDGRVIPQIGFFEWFTLIFAGIVLLVRASDPTVKLRSLYLDALVFFYSFYYY